MFLFPLRFHKTIISFFLKCLFPPLCTDVDVPHPDEKSIITYVSSLYDVMPRVPDVQDGVKANVSPPLADHQFSFPPDNC